MRTHHGLYDSVLEADEERDNDRHKDLKKDKLTLTECIVALIIALTCVSLHAVFLGKCSTNLSRSVIHSITCAAFHDLSPQALTISLQSRKSST